MNRTPLRRTGPPKRRKGLKRTRMDRLSDAAHKCFLSLIRIRDQWTCQRCGKRPKIIHVHHKLPRSRGGLDVESNACCLCLPCHRKIHDHTAPDWRDYIVSKKHA